MANLGFQAIFHIFESDPRVAADRAFLPDPDERDAIPRRAPSDWFRSSAAVRSRDFDILAFSISFETDYLNVLSVLRMAGIPARRADRAGRNYPLIIAGGSAVFLNPEPIADFIDLFLIGEGEEMVPEFIERCAATRGAPNQLHDLASVEGAYRPDCYTPVYDDAGTPRRGRNIRARKRAQVSRRLIGDLNRFNTSSLILTEESVFGDMFLVEASRGCQWGCRFCAAGFMYRPIRYRAPGTHHGRSRARPWRAQRDRPGRRGDGERAGRGRQSRRQWPIAAGGCRRRRSRPIAFRPHWRLRWRAAEIAA